MLFVGVDVVLNSLSEEKLMASVRCLCPHGRFLEIGKRDLGNNAKLGSSITFYLTLFAIKELTLKYLTSGQRNVHFPK